jgi:hypothetical protein
LRQDTWNKLRDDRKRQGKQGGEASHDGRLTAETEEHQRVLIDLGVRGSPIYLSRMQRNLPWIRSDAKPGTARKSILCAILGQLLQPRRSDKMTE